jgi:general secretion pathway protein G
MRTGRGTLRSDRGSGFTFVELVAVLAIVALLLSVVAPQYLRQTERAREAVLATNLRLLRDAIDRHYADRGAYPESLDVLVERRYLREVPRDPITDSKATWMLVERTDGTLGVFDVRSRAAGTALDGRPFASF